MKKTVKKTVVLPIGRCSFPYLSAPDLGREYSDGCWKFDHLIPKSMWVAKHPKLGITYKEIVEGAILEVASDLMGKKVTKLEDVKKHMIKDLASDPKTDPKMRDFLLIRCKNKKAQPLIVDINKKEMKQEDIAKIKGGDWVEPIVTVYSYTQSGGGVTCGLDLVRFVKPGEAFGLGAAKHLGLLDEIEVTAEEFTDEELKKLAS